MTTAYHRTIDLSRRTRLAIGPIRREPRPTRRLAERVLRLTAATVGVFVLGAWASELLWALVAGSLVLALGDPA